MKGLATSFDTMKSIFQRGMARACRSLLRAAECLPVPRSRMKKAVAVAQKYGRDGLACTIGYFGGSKESARQIGQAYLSVIDVLKQLTPPGYISIKVPVFDYDSIVMDAVVRHSIDSGCLLHFDSHWYETAEPTLDCVRHAVRSGAAVGLSIPACWKRSADDAEAMVALGVRVRIVKGEFEDPENPNPDLRACFLQVVDRVAGKAKEVAIATHDAWLAEESFRRLQASGTQCVIELLDGFPKRDLLALAKRNGIPVIMYVPFGAGWLPYILHYIVLNPSRIAWVLKDRLAGWFRRDFTLNKTNSMAG